MRFQLTVVAAALAIALSSPDPLLAQQPSPPDLEMLLNFDLFRPKSGSEQNFEDGGSLLDQIQALRTMGLFESEPEFEPSGRRTPSTQEDAQ